jgi:ATP-GRASP peptide maturase of grasp-with-spasm system
MILILSQEARESSTESVMDWLDRYGARYQRVNGEDLDGKDGFGVLCTASTYETVDSFVGPDPDEVEAVWYRRWQHNRKHHSSDLFTESTPEMRPGHLMSIVAIQGNKELDRISEAFFQLYREAKWLSAPDTAAPNKIRVLRAASRHGFEIPDTLISDSRKTVARFAERHGGAVVAKPASDACFLPLTDGAYVTYTCSLSAEDIESLPENFFPSLFQEQIEKRYEVRVFVLNGTCYSMAIFSQDDAQTEVDFRRYNFDVPNRNVPYALSDDLEARIAALMDDLGYTTGSIDLIRAADGRYVFLEINPIGQYGMVSQPCNYHLDREIARHLLRVSGESMNTNGSTSRRAQCTPPVANAE